ncbi:MAG TPA: Ig-like domain-containing protein [Candidatus Limnocylindria bacterium]
MILRSLVVIGAGALVLAGVLYVASTVDARAPEVLSIGVTQTVGGDAELALITTSIEIAFSETVDADAAAAALRIEPEVEGAASWSGSTMIFTPTDPLALESSYTVSLGPGIQDLAGNEMAELPPPFTFATAGRPTIAETDPVDGATEVAVDAPISVRFSTLMDTASVEGGLRIEPAFAHELRWSEEVLEIVPAEPLEPDRDYEVVIDADAADVAGVELGEAVALRFRTVAPGLTVEALVPADGVDGIAPATVIAIVFDRPIDPDSAEDGLFVVTPEVAGTLEVTALPGEELSEDGSGRVLRFTPSGPLPPTTTFAVELAPGVSGASGRGLAEPVTWSFTTGAPPTTVSNQITFVSDRSGIANVWAMNPDGTAQRQLSAEMAPILDYAVAPDGSSLVVADGRRLVFFRADGSDRRVLTGDDHWELDPTYSPSGALLLFARVDAATGRGLGLWSWEVGGGDAAAVELPRDVRESPAPSASGEPSLLLRAPRFSPDGQALAFVDAAGAVGILELPGQRLTRVAFQASAPPRWLPDSGELLLTGQADGDGASAPLEVPAGPLEPDADAEVYRLARSGTSATDSLLPRGWRVIAVATDGTIAYADGQGHLGTTGVLAAATDPDLVRDAAVAAGAFAPGEAAMVIVVDVEDGVGSLELLDLETGRRTMLAPDGSQPRWLP